MCTRGSQILRGQKWQLVWRGSHCIDSVLFAATAAAAVTLFRYFASSFEKLDVFMLCFYFLYLMLFTPLFFAVVMCACAHEQPTTHLIRNSIERYRT